jgi:hypothetical protein
MSRSYPIILIFCVGCSLNSSPVAGHGAAPPKQLFHTDGSQGIAKLLGTAGGGSAGRVLVGHAGTGMVGNPSLSQLPDAQEPQPDAAIDAPDAGADAATTLPDAAQTPPNATLPPPDAGADAGTLATPGKTCAPCQAATDCSTGYICARNSFSDCTTQTPSLHETVCLQPFTGQALDACDISTANTTYKSVPRVGCTGCGEVEVCGPGACTGCAVWLQNHPNAGF